MVNCNDGYLYEHDLITPNLQNTLMSQLEITKLIVEKNVMTKSIDNTHRRWVNERKNINRHGVFPFFSPIGNSKVLQRCFGRPICRLRLTTSACLFILLAWSTQRNRVNSLRQCENTLHTTLGSCDVLRSIWH